MEKPESVYNTIIRALNQLNYIADVKHGQPQFEIVNACDDL